MYVNARRDVINTSRGIYIHAYGGMCLRRTRIYSPIYTYISYSPAVASAPRARAHRRKTCDPRNARAHAHQRTVVKHATRGAHESTRRKTCDPWRVRPRACAQCRYAIFCVSRTGTPGRSDLANYDNMYL